MNIISSLVRSGAHALRVGGEVERWRMFTLPIRISTPTDKLTSTSGQPFGVWALAWGALIVHKVFNMCATAGVIFLRFSSMYQ